MFSLIAQSKQAVVAYRMIGLFHLIGLNTNIWYLPFRIKYQLISFCRLCVIFLTKEERSLKVDTCAIEESRTYGGILNVQAVMKEESMVISRCCFAEDGMDFFIGKARIARLCFLRAIKFLIYGVVFAVPFFFA